MNHPVQISRCTDYGIYRRQSDNIAHLHMTGHNEECCFLIEVVIGFAQ